MGYTHEDVSVFIPPGLIEKSAGTWTPAVASNVPSHARTAANASFTLLIPVTPPQSGGYRNGAKLKSIDVYYKIAAAAADDFATVELEKVSLPADSSAPTGAAVTTTCDAAHDSAAERKGIEDHTMTVTLDTAEWMDDDSYYVLQLVIDAAAETVFTLYGARANFIMRN